MLALFLLLCVAATAGLYTETFLFTDARYSNMTLAAAEASFRLARRASQKRPVFVEHARITVWVLDNTPCALFRPFWCVPLRYGELSYQSMLQKRMLVLYAYLQHPSDAIDGVFMLDSDVLLRRNVADRFERLGADLVFQRELPCAARYCANGGVWWARARSPVALRVVERALSLMSTLAIPDQDALDVALSLEPDARVVYLPATTHPNGFVAAANDRLEASRVHLVHANWCAPTHKERRLRDVVAAASRWLPVPRDANVTFVCDALRTLDARNRAQILGCRSARACALRVAERCNGAY